MPNVLGRVAVRSRRCGAESDPTNRSQPLEDIVDRRIFFTPRLHPPAGELAMSISFDLPADVEEQLRRDHANLDGLAKEAALVELYRQGSITQHQLAESLDKTRVEIDELLKQRNVTEDLVTAEEVAEQVATLRRLLGS
jgi:predicted HTH domain antitoxin